jgi:hypothetical protein
MGWADYMDDQPVNIEGYSGHCTSWMVYSGGADVPSDIALIRAVDDLDWQEMLCCFGDYVELPDGRIKFEGNYDARPIYYKSLESAARGVFAREYGYNLADLGVDMLITRSDSLYVTWRKSAYKKYSGGADTPSIDYIQSILDNEIYGFEISDESGEVVESCYGFVGDPEYCEREAQNVVDYLEAQDKRNRVDKLKRLIKASVPLHNRLGLLCKT